MRHRTAVLLACAALFIAGCTSAVGGSALPATRVSASSTASTSSVPAGPPTRTSSSAPGTGDGPIDGPIPRPTPGGSGAGVVPAGLEEFYEQQLDWQSCAAFSQSIDDDELFGAPGLDCANLIVPLDYDDPDGPTVAIALLRAAATGDRVGSLPMNPGGPGGSGTQFAAQVAGSEEWQTLHESFDFIGFDPRGVGASRPRLTCFTDLEHDSARAENNRTDSDEGVAAITGTAGDYVADCRTRTGADQGIDGGEFLANIGTDMVVKDLDVLRSALGEDKLTYLGFSYGTLIGQGYAGQFPANVRAMLLDGVVDPDKGPTALDQGQAVGFQTVFDAYATWCAEQDSCPLGKDPAQATASYQELVRPLLDTPVSLSDGRTLTFSDAIGGTVLALYANSLWPTLSQALADLDSGGGDLLMALGDYYLERDSEGRYGAINDVYNAVGCMDYPRVALDDTLVKDYNTAAPFQDSGDPAIAVPTPLWSNPHYFLCNLWPVEPTGVTAATSGDGFPTLLVVSTTNDPATPYQDGVTVAQRLSARLLTFEGDQHTAYLSTGSACVNDAGTAYLVDLTLPPPDITC